MGSNDTPAADETDLKRQLTFLNGAEDEEWDRLLEHAETLVFESGDVLVRAGDRDDSFFILTAGTVEVFVDTIHGEKIFDRLEAGTAFGEMAFFDGMSRSASIRALAAGSASRVNRRAFSALATRDALLAQRVLFDLGKILTHRLRVMNRTLEKDRRHTVR